VWGRRGPGVSTGEEDVDAVVRVWGGGELGVPMSMLEGDVDAAVVEGATMLCVGGPGWPMSTLRLECLRVTVRVLNCVFVE
jgi:hypothetical protein